MTFASWALLPALALTALAIRALAQLMRGRELWRVRIPPSLVALFCSGFGLWISSLWMRALAFGAIECISLRGSVCRVPVYTMTGQAGGFWTTAAFTWIVGTALLAIALTEFRRWRESQQT